MAQPNPIFETSTATDNVESWEQARPGCRERWHLRYGSAAACWDDVEPMYRYGHEQHARPEHRGRRWDELEPEFRRGWGKRYPNTPWARASEGVRDGWEHAMAMGASAICAR